MIMLLAENSFLRQLSQSVREADIALNWQTGLMVASVVAITTAAAWLIARLLRRRERRALNSPAELFAELAAAHGLRYRERQLLTRLAQHHNLQQPATLFVEPALWSPEQLGPVWDRCRPELDELRVQLFAA